MMTRRTFLIAAMGAATAAAAATGAGGGPIRRCTPKISGALWWNDPAQSIAWGESGWRDELDEQRRIGFDLLWLCATALSVATDEGTAALRELLDLCARRKVRVLIDCGGTGDWYMTLNAKAELEACSGVINSIARSIGGHPAFYGWYVPQEIYMAWDGMATYIDELYPALVSMCKAAVDVPVTVSPFFITDRDGVYGDFRYNEPDEYRDYWARLIRRSGFDVVMMQDSGEHFAYVTDDMRRPFFESMFSACRSGGAQFWGNVECAEFNYSSKEEYISVNGRVHHSAAKEPRWRPVPVDRLRTKLELASEYCADIVTWGYREFCRPALSDAAAKWYADYRAYYGSIR